LPANHPWSEDERNFFSKLDIRLDLKQCKLYLVFLLTSIKLVEPVQSVGDLGMYIDSSFSNVLSSCYSSLRKIRSIKWSLPFNPFSTLVTSLVHSRLDYCNVVFAGLPACDFQCPQSVLNATVRLITIVSRSRRDRITPLLREHQWLPIRQRIDYKLCVMVHRCLHERASFYLMELSTPFTAAYSRAGLRLTMSRTVAVSRTLSSLGH